MTDKNGTREIGEENQVYSLCQNGYNKAANQMYVLAADWKEQFSTGEKYLYRLDLESETFTKIFDEPVEKAAYCDGELYIWQNLLFSFAFRFSTAILLFCISFPWGWS